MKSKQKPVMVRDEQAVSVIRRWQKRSKPRVSLNKAAAQLILLADANRPADSRRTNR